MTFNRPLGPFACLYEERTPTAPVNKQKSGWQRKLEARIKAEGRNPDSAKAQTAKVLRVNQYSDVARATDSDKTKAIVGKPNGARSQ